MMVKKEVSKKWWQSKAILVAVVGLVIAVVSAAGVVIPPEVYVALASAGLYGLRKGTKEVK